jgi:hypothetical protein
MAWLLPSFLTSPFAQPLISKSGATPKSSKLDDWSPEWRWGFSSPALKIPPRFVLPPSSNSMSGTFGPSLRGTYEPSRGMAVTRVGPERHCRKRRGPSAGGGLGNRGAAHAFLCIGREHGGTQAVSPRSGSPREARREGPTRAAHLISRQLSLGACRRCLP